MAHPPDFVGVSSCVIGLKKCLRGKEGKGEQAMQGQKGHYQYTPTNLVEFFRSPFASWMSRFHHDFPGHLQPDADTPELVSLASAGARHEQQILERFHADTPDVREIPATAD